MTRSSGRHPTQEVFEATGEKVQIFARDARLPADAALMRLDRGMAASTRPDARAGHLVCPIPGCEDPRLTTRAGSRRDHFAHLNLVGPPHAPETWFHYAGKHVVGDWLRARYPEARVVVDAEAVENRQIPDVLAEFPDGRRFAFEVQYAALDTDEWVWRHAGYVVQGITDVWLLGHLPRYLRHPRGSWEADRYVRTPLYDKIVETGAAVRWINPDERLIATPRHASDAVFGRYLEHDDDFRWERLELGFDALDACRIEGNAFLTPTDDADRAAADRLAEARRVREEAERRAEERRQAQIDENARMKAWVEEQRAARARDYELRLRPELTRELPEVLELLEVELKTDFGIFAHPAVWHAKLWREFIEGRIGSEFTVPNVCAPFMATGKHKDKIFMAVRGYLAFLRRRGYLEFETSGYWIEGWVTVAADAKHPPEAPVGSWTIRY